MTEGSRTKAQYCWGRRPTEKLHCLCPEEGGEGGKERAQALLPPGGLKEGQQSNQVIFTAKCPITAASTLAGDQGTADSQQPQKTTLDKLLYQPLYSILYIRK